MLKVRNGFTLLEVLIAVLITSIVVSLVYGTFSTILRNTNYAYRKLEASRSVSLVMRQVELELQSAFLTKNNPNIFFLGEKNFLLFCSISANYPYDIQGSSDQLLISYYVNEEKEGKTLLKRLNPLITSVENPSSITFELLSGLKDIQFQFHDAKTGNWMDRWDSRGGQTQGRLPDMVRIKVIVSDESGDQLFISTASIPASSLELSKTPYYIAEGMEKG